ncbi:MAG: DnaB-like helicase C-terminal domain-containing protein [Candidatus Nanoarchaeia archaeon]|jgi:hypothetical protein|nr:DnaB-like helicase C-terminal domain-containing protein [Candidatus Nanoarchaeia archaeon]
MKRETIKLNEEKNIITYMIVDDRYLTEIIPIFRIKYLKGKYSKTIASWILEYYEQYKCAPKKNIQDLYISKYKTLEKENNDSDNDNIKLFLTNLSKNYEEITEETNIDFLIDEAKNYLKVRSGELIKEELEDAILINNGDKIDTIISQYKRIEKPTGQGVDLLHDNNKILEALTIENSIIIKFPGDLGKIIQPISRGDFVSFFGPAKRGKSFWLWYSAEVAMSQGCKVIYIPLEMTETEIIKRAWPSITGYPLYNRDIKLAYFEYDEESNLYKIVQEKNHKKGFDISKIDLFQKKLRRLYRKGRIKIIPMVGATVEMIKSTCDNLYYYENFIPDCIIIDYADYMEPSKGFKNNDNRQIINNIWKGLRDFANERKIAIITASHTEKSTFDTDIKTKHASEDIRKINHVTMAVSLNATNQEKENNIIRLGLMEIREGRAVSDQVVCLQCLDLGKACTESKMKKEVYGYSSIQNEVKSKKYIRKNV